MKFFSVGDLLGKLVGRKAAKPGWVTEEEDFAGWQAVRSLQSARSKEQRRARLILWSMLAALPIAILSCAVAMNANTRANSATAAATTAVADAQILQQEAYPNYRSQATAALQHRLTIAGHPFREAMLVPQPLFYASQQGEDHVFDLIYRGQIVAEALVTADATGYLSIWFRPPSGIETGYRLSGFYNQETVEEGIADSFGAAGQPGGMEWRDEQGNISSSVYARISEGGLTITDYPNASPADLPSGMQERLEEWLVAWSSNNQSALLELGNYTNQETLPSNQLVDLSYVPGSMQIKSATLFSPNYYVHIRFVMADEYGAMLVQDLKVRASIEGTLIRVYDATTVGDRL